MKNPLKSILGWVGKSLFAQTFLRGDDVGDYDGRASLREPYLRSTWVRAAIEILSGPIKSVPLRFASDARGSQSLLKDANLEAFWQNPAMAPVRQTMPGGVKPGQLPLGEVVEATIGWLKLKGEAFWLLDDTWLLSSRTTPRTPFIIARPSRMTEIREGAELVGWRYSDGGGRMWTLLPEQVLQIRCWNPTDEFRGAGAYEAAAIAAESDYLAGLYGRNLMRNNGDRGPIISAKGGMLSDQQQEQMIRMLREKRAAAARGDFRPAFLSGEVTVEDPKAQALDAALIAQRIENRDEIAVAFGVPPSMFHVTASYSIGSASDYFRLIETGSMPMASRLADAIEVLSGIMLGRPVYAWFDFSQHSTMQQVRSERIEKDAKTLFGMGVPFSTINETLGLGLPRFEGDETGWLPINVQAVEAALNPPEMDQLPEGGTEKPTDPQKALPFANLERLIDPMARLEAAIVLGARKLPGTTDKAARASKWQAHFVQQKAWEKKFASKVRRVLMGARSEMLRKLSGGGTSAPRTEPPLHRAAAADFLFDLSGFTARLIAELRKVQRPALDAAGKEVFDELSLDDPFEFPEPAAIAYLQQRENKIRGASDEIYDRLRRELEEGIEGGETTDELASRVRATFGAIEDGHALTIAATETSSCFGVGRQRAMEVAGVEWKEWVTSGLDNVRATHEEANGQIVRADEPFQVGASLLMHPGDPTGPAEEVINCRCVAIATTEPKEGA